MVGGGCQLFGWAGNRFSEVGIACVASVPVRSELNLGCAKEFFAFGPRERCGESKEVEGRGWGRGKKGTLAGKPLILKNAH